MDTPNLPRARARTKAAALYLGVDLILAVSVIAGLMVIFAVAVQP
jgi:hypothetical protein